MTEGKSIARPIRFGPFEVDVEARELRKRGVRVRLPDQPFTLLLELLQRPGEVVTREELQRKLWPSNTFVDFDRGLNKAMNRVREVLNDSAEEPRYIETIPRCGYRFIGEVELAPPMPSVGMETLAPVPLEPARRRRPWLRAAALTGTLLAILVAVLSFGSRRSAPSPAFRSSLLPPPETSFQPRNFAVSPDGTRLVFSALGTDGKSRLWVRALSAAEASRLDNTDDGSYPFWSPDSTRVGFFAGGKLKTIQLETAEVKVLADAPLPTGGSWSKRGVIVFGAGVGQPLYRVAEDGGERMPATRLPGENTATSSWWPCFLPDGLRFLYSVQWTTPGAESGTGLYAGTLESHHNALVSSEISGNVAFVSGRILFARKGRILAQRFDAERLRPIGMPVALSESEIEQDPVSLRSGFSPIQTGGLVFESVADFRSRLTWLDPSGRELGSIAATGYHSPNLSPDGRSVAVACDDWNHDGRPGICVYDLARAVSMRLDDGSSDAAPIWSSDGKDITYEWRDDQYAYLKRITVDGGRPAQILRKGGRMSPRGWLADGRLLFTSVDSGGPKMYLTFHEQTVLLWPGSEGQLSPDGKWIAQAFRGIMVNSVAEPRTHLQIANSGAQPRWRHDGRQLFYIAADKKLMAATFDPATGKAGAPQPLFQTRIVAASIAGFQYDVSADGRFLVNSLPSVPPPLTLVTGLERMLR